MSAIAEYDRRAGELVARYETLDFETVHGDILDLLPPPPASVLDIGAGSGRDAAWLAKRGHPVTAVEPSAGMRAEAATRGRLAGIDWRDDSLPELRLPGIPPSHFALIQLSGVWMHVRPDDRPAAFSRLAELLAPGGLLVITLRLGEPDPSREMYPVSREELSRLAASRGLLVQRVGAAPDLLGRANVHWQTVAIRGPH